MSKIREIVNGSRTLPPKLWSWGAAICLCVIAYSTLADEWWSSSDSHGPNTVGTDLDPTTTQANSGNCSGSYTIQITTLEKEAFCTKNCAGCVDNENGTWSPPVPGYGACDCTDGTTYNETSITGKTTTHGGTVCLTVGLNTEVDANGHATITALKGLIEDFFGIPGGTGDITINAGIQVAPAGTFAIPFTYTKTTWDETWAMPDCDR